jgi:hypothetical protein
MFVASGDSAQLFVDPVLAAMPWVFVQFYRCNALMIAKMGLLRFAHCFLTLQR